MFTPWSDATPTATAPARGIVRAGRAGLAFVGLIAVWLGGYALGVFPWLGYVDQNRRSISLAPVGIVGEDRSGWSGEAGLSTFVFFKGQTIVIAYDVQIRRGCLWLQVWHVFHEGRDSSVSTCIDASGHGEWTVPVTETGVYSVILDAFPTQPGSGWDISYSAWWGARR